MPESKSPAMLKAKLKTPAESTVEKCDHGSVSRDQNNLQTALGETGNPRVTDTVKDKDKAERSKFTVNDSCGNVTIPSGDSLNSPPNSESNSVKRASKNMEETSGSSYKAGSCHKKLGQRKGQVHRTSVPKRSLTLLEKVGSFHLLNFFL